MLPLITALAVVALLALPAWAGATPRHTPRVAQTNVLRAARVLGRFDPALLDPETRLLRNNSMAVCHGVGRSRAGAYVTLSCVVSSGRAHLAVRYSAQRDNGFELKRLRVWRTA